METMLQSNPSVKPERVAGLSKKGLAQLEVRLIDIAKLVGFQNPPEGADLIAMLVAQYFGQLTIDDVSKAFIDNSADRLIKKIVPYYNSFDWEFIGQVLSCYVETQRLKKIERPTQKIKTDNLLEEKSEFQDLKNHYLSLLQFIKNTKTFPSETSYFNGIHWKCYLFLFELYVINPTYDEKKKLSAKVLSLIHLESDTLSDPLSRRSYRENYAKHTVMYQNRCRSEYFKEWIQKKLLEENWLDDEIKRIENKFDFEKKAL